MSGDIAVVLVSWDDRGELYDAIDSLARSRERTGPTGPGVSLVVIVNGPSPVRPEEILRRWPDAAVAVNASNRGFGPAANQGADLSRAPYLLFLNPDTRAEGDPFTEIAAGFAAHPEAVALAPRLLEEDREPRSSGGRLAPPGDEDQFTFQLRRLPSIAADARELMLLDHLAPDNRGRRRDRYGDTDRDSPFEVEQAAAAALAVRADAFRAVGGFATDFLPAWFEDVDLCARLSAKGKILYWPGARFRHRGGVSADRLGYARFLPIYYRNALRYRARRYPAAARLLYRPLLAAGMALRLLALPLRQFDPRPKRESALAYLRVLRLALTPGIPDPKRR
jgi:N-acetylglucosaminyl-diphospho-decaprenol L-rhamnosyltransferase